MTTPERQVVHNHGPGHICYQKPCPYHKPLATPWAVEAAKTGQIWHKPEDGPFSFSLSRAGQLMFGWHSEAQRSNCCPPDHLDWRACEVFTLARLRGICHTVYVVVMPGTYIRDDHAPGGYAVLDWLDDGPAYQVRAELTEGYETVTAAFDAAMQNVRRDWAGA